MKLIFTTCLFLILSMGHAQQLPQVEEQDKKLINSSIDIFCENEFTNLHDSIVYTAVIWETDAQAQQYKSILIILKSTNLAQGGSPTI
jgi:hypothetical protein